MTISDFNTDVNVSLEKKKQRLIQGNLDEAQFQSSSL